MGVSLVRRLGPGVSHDSVGRIDPEFAKEQLILFLREWYMHPNGQIPAYEFAFCDVNPPVHAWACWRVYKMTGAARPARPAFPGARLPQAADQLHLVGQSQGRRRASNIFAGGFLGLDNIGVFDRSKPLPDGGALEQADGTAWMAFYCATMLAMALELAAGQSGLRGRGLEVLRAFRRHRRCHEHASAAPGCGTRRTASTTTRSMCDGRPMPLRIRSHGRAHSRCWPWRCSTTR